MKNKRVLIGGVELPIEELHMSYLTYKLRNEYGFIESSKKNVPVNNKGEVMPMYTYPCYEWLNSIDWTNCNVFEYGTGFSTLWWVKKKVNYYGVEDNKEWYDRVNGFMTQTGDVKFKDNHIEYINSIYEHSFKFDVIVIDGQVRFDCVKPAFDKLKDNGIIIFDNSDWHKQTKAELDKCDLIPIHFHGFKPLHIDSETTSCYISKKFNKKAKHIIPMAGTIREQHKTDKTIL